MEFQGSFHVTKEDNIRYNLFLIRKKLVSTCAFIFVALFGLLFLLNMLMLKKDTGWVYLVFIAIALAGVGLYVLYAYFIRVRIRVSQSYRSGQMKDFVQQITVDRNGVRIASETNAKDVAFKYIWFVHETKKTFYLFVSDKIAIFLSKSQMRVPEDVHTLRMLFSKYMDARKLLLRKD